MYNTKTLLQELEQEAQTTRKMLALVPDDKHDWQPHPKSMTMKHLAVHIAELPGWINLALTTDGLDFAEQPYEQEKIADGAELMAYFERTLADGKAHLAGADDEALLPRWTLRKGEQIYTVRSKGEVIHMTLCQMIHHRAQLGVYLRLLNVPIPGSYGPSADELGL